MQIRRAPARFISWLLCLALTAAGCGAPRDGQAPDNASGTTDTSPATETIAAPFGNAPTLPAPKVELSATTATNDTAAAAMPSTTSWPMFRGDPQATGVSPDQLSDDPQLIWKVALPDASFEATATIVDGMVYIGSLDGNLYALELATGKEKWRFPTELGFYAAASVRDGHLYVGDADGAFYCIDVANGQQKWSVQARAEIDGAANFHGDHVLFGSQDATLYCLDAATGREVWKHTIDDQIRCSPTIIDDRAFVAGCDGHLHVIDLTNGESVSKVAIDSQTGCTPAASGDFVYFGTEGGVFFCIDWRQGEIVWKYHDASRSLPFRSSAALTDEIVVVGGRDKQVHAFDPKNGAVRWKFPAKARIDSSPVIVAGRAYVGGADGRLYGLDLQSGEAAWEYEAGGGFIASPAVAEGRLVIGNDDGEVFCFGNAAKHEEAP